MPPVAWATLVGVVVGAVIGFLVARIAASLEPIERDPDAKDGWSRRLVPLAQQRWQVLVASLCSAALAALVALDVDDSWIQTRFSKHSIVSATTTGILLLGITLLVAEALVERARARAWTQTMRAASNLVIVAARRGAGDVAAVLREANGGKPILRLAGGLPEPNSDPIVEAARVARKSHQALIALVAVAVTPAAPAGGGGLAHSAVTLLKASNALSRTITLYAADRQRLVERRPPTADEVQRAWQTFARALIDFNRRRKAFDRSGGPTRGCQVVD